MSDPQDLVSIYKAANPIEANLVRNLLADEGIEAEISEQNEPLVGLGIAAPDVLVRVADEVRAREFMGAYEEKQIDAAESEDDDDADEDDEDDEDDFEDDDFDDDEEPDDDFDDDEEVEDEDDK